MAKVPPGQPRCGLLSHAHHGDAERKIVVCLRLDEPIPLHFQWFQRHEPVGEAIVVPRLRHGDLYAMSAKAVGTDWKQTAGGRLTLRHAAGAARYVRRKGGKKRARDVPRGTPPAREQGYYKRRALAKISEYRALGWF